MGFADFFSPKEKKLGKEITQSDEEQDEETDNETEDEKEESEDEIELIESDSGKSFILLESAYGNTNIFLDEIEKKQDAGFKIIAAGINSNDYWQRVFGFLQEY